MAAITKKRERSKAYPGTSLEECVQNLHKIKKGLGATGQHDRDSLATALGYAKPTGAVNTKISALVQFGLLTKKNGLYSVVVHSKRITDPISDIEKEEGITEAFFKPRLYSEIMDKFSSDGKIPSQLATHLHRFHGISESACEGAAKLFAASGVYAGVLNEEGTILRKTSESQKSDSEEIEDAIPQITGTVISPAHEINMEVPNRQYIFPLSQGQAHLKLPGKLFKRDINILKKHIEILELEAEE